MRFDRWLGAACLAASAIGLVHPALAQVQPLPDNSTIIIVRHADKKPGDGDVDLTSSGIARAERLAKVVEDAGVTAIVTVPLKRTQATAAPTAKLLPKERLAVVDEKEVEAKIRSFLPGTVLVIGRTTNIPQLVAAFGGQKVEVRGSDFGNLFVLSRSKDKTNLIRARYGAP